MTRFLVFSDLHLHTWAQHASVNEEGFNTRLWHQRACLRDIADYAIYNGIDDIFFAGDWFHTHGTVQAQALWVTQEFGSRLIQNRIRWYIMVGNHDLADKAQRVHSLKILQPYGVVIDAPMFTAVGTKNVITIGMLPFTESPQVLERFWETKMDLALLHQGVQNVPMGSGFVLNELLEPSSIPPDIKKVLTGHYHSRRQVNNQLEIIGSVNHLTWADAGDVRGFLDVTYAGGQFEIVHVECTQAPTFRTLTRSQVDLDPHVANSWVRVTGPYNELKGVTDDIRESLLREGALSVEFDLTTDEHEMKETVSGKDNQSGSFDLHKLAEDHGHQAPDDFTRDFGSRLRHP